MNVIQEAVDIAKEFEGFSELPYHDTRGNLTIGYGHKMTAGELPTRLDKTQASELLAKDLAINAKLVADLLHPIVLNDNQFSALVLFTFNEGYRRFRDSFMLRCIKAGDLAGAALEFPRWIYIRANISQWQVKRRAAEQALFRKAENG